MKKQLTFEDKFNVKVLERFLSKLEEKENGCIEWTGVLHDGYGQISVGGREGKKIKTNRYVLEMILCNDIPSHIFACHRCDNRACVNPEHIFPGTHQDNMTDMVNKGRSVTVNGNAKINQSIANEIRASNELGKDLAIKYGVSKATISEIKNNKIWIDK